MFVSPVIMQARGARGAVHSAVPPNRCARIAVAAAASSKGPSPPSSDAPPATVATWRGGGSRRHALLKAAAAAAAAAAATLLANDATTTTAAAIAAPAPPIRPIESVSTVAAARAEMSRQLAALATLRADVEATLSCLAVDVPNECGGGGDVKGSANGGTNNSSSSGGFVALRARLQATADDCDRLRAAAAIVGADMAENRPGSSSSSSLFFGRGRSVSPADLEYYEAVEAAAYALDDRILELHAALRRVAAAEEDFARDLGLVPAAITALQSAAESFVVTGSKP